MTLARHHKHAACMTIVQVFLLATIVTVGGGSDTPVTVVYSALFQGKLEYFTHPGFTIIGNVTNTLRLRIDGVRQEHVGRYECRDLSSMPGNYESCNFILKVGDAPSTSRNIDKKDATLLPDISKEGEGIMHYVKPLIITTVCVVLLLIVIGGIITMTALYKRIKKKTDGLENGSDERMLTNNGSQ